MITLDSVPSFKYTRQVVKLPFDTNAKGYNYQYIYLIPDSKYSVDVYRHFYSINGLCKRYYRPFKYRQKIFTRMSKVNLSHETISELGHIAASIKMQYTPKPSLIGNRSVLIDTTDFHTEFALASMNRPYRVICHKYLDALKYFLLLTTTSMTSTNKIICIDAESWHIGKSDKSQAINISNKMMNPISILFFLLKKDPFSIKTIFGEYTFIIFDGGNGFFTFKGSDIDKESYTKFATMIRKFSNAADIEILQNQAEVEDKETETHLSKDKQLAMKDMLSTSDLDDPDTISTLIDSDDEDSSSIPMEDSPDGIDSSTDDDEDDDLDEDETVAEEPADDETVVDTDNKSSDEESETEEDDEKAIQKELIQINHDKMNRTTRANSARDAELREKQKKIRMEKLSIEDLEELNIDTSIATTQISDKVFTTNDNVKTLRFDNFNDSYNKELMERDILNVFKSLNDKTIPVYITDIKVEDTSTAMDLKKTYTVKLEDTNRVRHTLTVDLPVIYDKNYLYLGGNRKQFVNQLFLKPIVKIAPDTVQICTDFKKIFVYRYGENLSPKIELFKKIVLAQDNAKYFRIRRGNGIALSKGVKTTIEYDSIAKDVISINFRTSPIEFTFNQQFFKQQVELGTIKLKEHELPIAYNSTTKAYISINPDSGVNETGDIIDNIEKVFQSLYGFSLWDLANGQKHGKRFMYTYCKIMAKNIPMILLLGYYEGLSTTLRKAGVEYYFSDTRPNKLPKEKGVIQFADGYLIFNRNPIENSLLVNGLGLVDTKGYPYADFDETGVYLDIFDALYSNRSLSSGLDSFYDNMIDPIAKQTLLQMGYPTDLHGLLLAANILLADNAHSSEIDMTHFRVRNNEMIAAMLYKTVSDAFSKYKRTSNNRNPVKISVPKDAVIKELMSLQNLEDYSVINPITEKEKLRSISAKGPSGINKDRAYTQEKRSFDDSMKGLMSISTSPDKNCGVVRELTVEPKVMDARGFIDVQKTDDEIRDVNMFSYAEALTPLGVSRDDSIRTAMATKQSKHIIPVKDMSPVLISTGIEKTLPYTISKDFSIKAEDSGVVSEIDEKSGMMVVTYKNGKSEAINLNPVVVKNGAGGFYLSNRLETKFKVGQKFTKDEILAINDTFFSDNFDGHKFNIGTLCKVACISSFGTFEDSKLITSKLSDRLSTEMIMNKHIILGENATVDFIVKKGDPINVGDKLISYEQSNSESMVNDMLANIGDDLKEEIVNLGKSQLKSKYTGVIEDIRIYSTLPLDQLSPSLAKIVGTYWKDVRKRKNIIKKYKIEDATYSGNTYYELDEPIVPNSAGKVKGYQLERGVIIEFYIKFYDPVGVGDKLVDFAALKGIVSDVIPEGQEPYTVDKPDEEISTIFPANSVLARKVPSILLTMFGNKMIVGLTERLKEIYYGKK